MTQYLDTRDAAMAEPLAAMLHAWLSMDPSRVAWLLLSGECPWEVRRGAHVIFPTLL